MSKSLRGALIGLVACVSLVGFASSAAALTVSPSGAYTASSGTTTLRFGSNGQTLSCATSRIGATINSSGTGTSPAGSAIYTSCSNALIGPFTVTQTRDWPIQVVLTAGPTLGLQVTVPANGVRLSNGSCSFTATGTVTVGRSYAGRALPITVATTDVLSVLSSSLRVDSVTGCSPLLTTVGLTATYAGSYNLSRSATVSG